MVPLVLLHVHRGSHALDKLDAGILGNLAEVTRPVVDLINIKVDLQGSAEVDAEPAKKRLPEGVLLSPLVGWDLKFLEGAYPKGSCIESCSTIIRKQIRLLIDLVIKLRDLAGATLNFTMLRNIDGRLHGLIWLPNSAQRIIWSDH